MADQNYLADVGHGEMALPKENFELLRLFVEDAGTVNATSTG